MSTKADAYYPTAGKEWAAFRGGAILTPGPPDPPAPTPSGMMIGCSEVKFNQLDALLRNPDGSKSGGTNTGFSARRTYNTSTLPTSYAGTKAAEDVPLGVASCWSYTPPSTMTDHPTKTAQGLHDSEWQAIFNGWPAGHAGWVSYGHEPENNGYNLADFRAANARIWNILQASSADKSKVKFGIIATADGYRTGQYTSFYPPAVGGVYPFDFIGIDFYEYERFPGDVPDPNLGYGKPHPPSFYPGPAIQFSITTGKPFLIGEYANHPDRSRPNYRPDRLQAQLDFYANQPNGCLAFMIYHSQLQPTHGPWWWDSFPNYNNITDQSDSDPTTVVKLRDMLAAAPRYVEG